MAKQISSVSSAPKTLPLGQKDQVKPNCVKPTKAEKKAALKDKAAKPALSF